MTSIEPTFPQKDYAFVIDNRKCIGCHACSVACKSENEVPLSVNRTWVKYVETGVFPDSQRHFQVTRCNHCANPPCVRICPTEAMYQRTDGIVEFDSSVCIGCKACMQACPYDAIYIDPETDTAAKCHFCAHRLDIGLEPACVVVCPEQAIIAGDLNNPASEVSQLVSKHSVTVRKPEQGTAPKLFYINGSEVSLHPTATERTPETYLWADVIPLHERAPIRAKSEKGKAQPVKERFPTLASGEATLRPPQAQGKHWRGPIEFGGNMAEQMVQVSYNAQHKIPWHWPVPAYLVTKGIGAGLFMLLATGWTLDLFAFDGLLAVAGGLLVLIMIALTTGLLVLDLEKPGRFLYILIRPQWRSWLARGAVILIGFSVVAGLWWLLEMLAYFDVTQDGLISTLRPLLLWAGFPFAVMAAIYTAFLFAQAEGRDLWQSPLLPFHLIVQAIMMGGAALLLLDLLLTLPNDIRQFATTVFTVALLIDLFVTLAGEFGIPHASEVAAQAAHQISHGAYRHHFWIGSVLLGHLLPLALLIPGLAVTGAIAGVAAIAGLYAFEYAFVMAPQEIPNS